MLSGLSRRLLTVLQLTRMALVFTAIADTQAALLLATHLRTGRLPSAGQMLVVAAISVGLYGFGMSLNDIIDRRRDRQIAAHRPLPSGRIGLMTAHLICVMLALLAFGGGIALDLLGGSPLCIALVGVTLGWIALYDLAGKYLVGPGLVTLGLVRFFHAMIPAAQESLPYVALLWHPLWLLNHVTILSTVCYRWEQKRPPLTRRHWVGVIATLLAINAAGLWLLATRTPGPWWENLRIGPELLLPLGASVVFVVIAWAVRRSSPTSRDAGQRAMLYGLLWLIVYDACFVGAYVSWTAGIVLGLLLPVAFLSVQLMRGWSKLVAASQRPEFKRAGT